MTKKLAFIMILAALTAFSAFADAEYRMGLIGSIEINENPFDDSSYDGMERFFPGFYMETVIDHVGFGMTALVRFSDTEAPAPAVGTQWDLTWLGSFDLRYHIFDIDSFIDPFVEVGIGCAGNVDMPFYDSGDNDYSEGRLNGLSLFGNVGGGAAVNFGCVNAGVKILYRFFNDRLPMSPYGPAAVTPFETCVFVGVAF